MWTICYQCRLLRCAVSSPPVLGGKGGRGGREQGREKDRERERWTD